ncbi:MAG: hypothetical protein WAO22_07685 [bacterium]|nr:hypothetical protein [Bacillota bacterium]
MQRTSRNLSRVIILVLMGLVVVFVASCTNNNAHTAIDSIHDHTEENENVRQDPMDEVEDTAVASDTGDRESWIGKYREYICVYDHKSKKLSEETYAQEEYIPYVELLENGEYHFNLNWFTEMKPVSGTWEIDEHNKNIAYLSKTEVINDEIILERLFDGAIALRGTYILEDSRFRALSTSSYGDIFLNVGMDLDDISKMHIRDYPNYWARLYADVIESTRGQKLCSEDVLEILSRLNGVGSARLYDVDADGVPELILGDMSDDEFYVLSIKEDEPSITALEADHPIIKETLPCEINIDGSGAGRGATNRFIKYMDDYIISHGK